jgi:hypothetical protein
MIGHALTAPRSRGRLEAVLRRGDFALTAETSVLSPESRRLNTKAGLTPRSFASDSTHLARPASVQASTNSPSASSRAAALIRVLA